MEFIVRSLRRASNFQSFVNLTFAYLPSVCVSILSVVISKFCLSFILAVIVPKV